MTNRELIEAFQAGDLEIVEEIGDIAQSFEVNADKVLEVLALYPDDNSIVRCHICGEGIAVWNAVNWEDPFRSCHLKCAILKALLDPQAL